MALERCGPQAARHAIASNPSRPPLQRLGWPPITRAARLIDAGQARAQAAVRWRGHGDCPLPAEALHADAEQLGAANQDVGASVITAATVGGAEA